MVFKSDCLGHLSETKRDWSLGSFKTASLARNCHSCKLGDSFDLLDSLQDF